MKTTIIILITFLSLRLFSSCDTSDKIENTASLSVKDITVDSKIDASLDDIINIVEDQYAVQQSTANKTRTTIKSILPTCATITTLLANGSWTRTIDFGTGGCTMLNGNSIKGKIIIRFSDDFNDAERTLSYSFDNFYHNGKLLQGNKSIRYSLKTTKLLAVVHPISIFTVDMKITFEDGKIYTRTGTKTKEMIEGNNTPLSWEDTIFLVTGNSTTVFPNGTSISSVITTPLRYVLRCKSIFPVEGILTITKNKSEGTLDFGKGTCDNLALLTIDGVATEIILEK